ncbi:MAG: hypothetical protein ACK5IC_06320 [Moheibacter sp.]
MEKIVQRDTLPKYTQYELSSMVANLINNSDFTVGEYAEVNNIDLAILSDVLDGNIIFKPKHYDLVGKLLNLTLSELLEEVSCESKAFFRTESYGEEVNNFVNNTKILFKEWVYQEKISGEIK